MKITLINYSKKPERIVAEAARLCYSNESIDKISQMSDEKIENLIKKIIRLGHESVLEHISFTFGIENISRITSHQLVRHRIASFSQKSQRYVKLNKTDQCIIPETITKNNSLKEKYKKVITINQQLYQELINKNIPAEDARYILPQSVSTSIIFTANARELRHFFRLRCCNRAQWEIREMATRMLEKVKKVAPYIFADAGPPCATGKCPEGELSCGHPWRNVMNE